MGPAVGLGLLPWDVDLDLDMGLDPALDLDLESDGDQAAFLFQPPALQLQPPPPPPPQPMLPQLTDKLGSCGGGVGGGVGCWGGNVPRATPRPFSSPLPARPVGWEQSLTSGTPAGGGGGGGAITGASVDDGGVLRAISDVSNAPPPHVFLPTPAHVARPGMVDFYTVGGGSGGGSNAGAYGGDGGCGVGSTALGRGPSTASAMAAAFGAQLGIDSGAPMQATAMPPPPFSPPLLSQASFLPEPGLGAGSPTSSFLWEDRGWGGGRGAVSGGNMTTETPGHHHLAFPASTFAGAESV